ncbi:alpha/beta fold hydrolase [Brevundimonas sp.]|uniref:alpha/beta fold hydrolase n=1 Tax=Brevundimonas sp. TaxID=1871086 RepID=UPI003918E8FE
MARLILTLLILVFATPATAQAFQSDRITVMARGAGPDVILIPGLASTPAVWDETVRALEASHRVHVVGVNGFGDAPPGANARGPLTAAIANEVRRYMSEQGVERPAVIGHSMGGQIALKMAADAPGRIGRVMVVDSSPFFPSLINSRATTADVAPIAEVARTAVLFLGDQVLRQQAGAVGARFGGAADAVVGAMGWQGGDRHVLAQGIYEVMTTDLRADLARVTAPVTVVYGWSESADSPRHQVDQGFRQGFLRLRNAARFERIEGAEHMVMIDRPREFLASVNRFLAP